MSIDLLYKDSSAPIGPRIVPNLFPTIEAPYRVAFIGEAPGRDEEAAGEPFVGRSGRLLNSLMGHAGITRQACFLGNVAQLRPPRNDITEFSWSGPEITTGVRTLIQDLDLFRPNLCVLLGNAPLHLARGEAAKITYWRGAVFHSAVLHYKCLATYHPAAVLYQYEWLQVLALDLRRVVEEGRTPTITPCSRESIIPTSGRDDYFTFVASQLQSILDNQTKISLDIEGWPHRMPCLSISTQPNEAFIIPFEGHLGSDYWTEDQEIEIRTLLSRICCSDAVPKTLQNSLYDNFVLSYAHKMPIVNVTNDTMLKHWEAYCELPKGLDFQASVYTNQPPWKKDGKNPDLHTFWRYCCTDSSVTYEIDERLDAELADSPRSRDHYQFNLALLHVLLYMELRGIRYNKKAAEERQAELASEIEDLNTRLEILAGRPLNVNSPKFRDFLYDELGLPEVRNRKTGQRTANYEALLSLAKKTDHPVCHTAIRLRTLRTRHGMLGIRADDDQRIRCGYNAVGTETGRLTCYTSPTGSGYNLQTIPEYDRDLFLADEDHWIFQCDLSGADGWTVAAHCARLSDSTMLDDLRAGIKIAKVVASMFIHGPDVSKLPRPALKERSDQIAKGEPIYFGSKCCQHGTNYGMGHVLLSKTIFIQSEGAVNIVSADAERLQNLYLLRYYGVRMWHNWARQKLKTDRSLTAASGHTRIFYGHPDEPETLKQFLAHEPQANTTYATNLAALRLWTDPENRRADGSLRIEPLHQVHDALVGQFRKADTQWALAKIREWFNNTLLIAGIPIVIPFEGAYGDSWGNLKEGRV